MVAEITDHATRAAFLSTPSLYFSLDEDSELYQNSVVFDFDPAFGKDPKIPDPTKNFVCYDFNHPEDTIPKDMLGTFDYVVIDPPFITEEVWTKYAHATKMLWKPEGGKVLGSTVAENEPLMKKLLGCSSAVFQPSIPNLVYQYNLFTSYPPTQLNEKNPEIPDDW